MNKYTYLVCCCLAIFVGCNKTQNQKENQTSLPDTTQKVASPKSEDNTKPKIQPVFFKKGDLIEPNHAVWKNVLFKIKKEDVQKLNGEIKAKLLNSSALDTLKDLEIYLVNKSGEVVDKYTVQKDGFFNFTKLKSDDYVGVHNQLNLELDARLIVPQAINDPVPQLNTKADNLYILNNSFRTLRSDDFIGELSDIEVKLTADKKGLLDNLVILVVDENGAIVRKFVNKAGKDSFVFEKLPKGNYSILIHNKPTGVQAETRFIQDDASLIIDKNKEAPLAVEPELKAKPDQVYIDKNKFKFLKRDEFKHPNSKVEIKLTGLTKEQLDHLVFIVLDAEGNVVEKHISNGKDVFVFEKLAQGDYTLLIHNKPENLVAETRLVEDETLKVQQSAGELEFNQGMMDYLKLNFKSALNHFHSAELKEIVEVYAILGRMYDAGEGVPVDHKKALHYYEKGVSKGDPKAGLGLGTMYLDGNVVKKDSIKAHHLFLTAFPLIQQKANEGHLFWEARLASMYNFGFGTAENLPEAAKWYSRAAEKGYAIAQFNLGVMYENGFGVRQDYATALKWYQKAVDQGDVDAEFKMGVMYANGYGVRQDYQQALKWYTKAADAGYADAQYNIGVLYANGLGVEKNYPEAIKWYTKAANQGFADAEYNLAVMYAKGQGVEKNNDTAINYYKMAARKGVQEAIKLLKKKGISWQE